LEPLGGASIPQPWQGGLPFRYHVGPGPVRARVQVKDDSATAAYKTIHDTFGVVRGAELPDEIVMIGGHRDGWGPGAADNVSGTGRSAPSCSRRGTPRSGGSSDPPSTSRTTRCA